MKDNKDKLSEDQISERLALLKSKYSDNKKDLSKGEKSIINIGTEFCCAIFVGFFFGYALDLYFKTLYLFIVIGVILGFISGILIIKRHIQNFNRNSKFK